MCIRDRSSDTPESVCESAPGGGKSSLSMRVLALLSTAPGNGGPSSNGICSGGLVVLLPSTAASDDNAGLMGGVATLLSVP